jgi:predicted tellurium resistance membrane protein TerC
MARLRLACYLVLGLALLSSAFGRPARGDAAAKAGPPAPDGVRVRVTTADEKTVEGTLVRPTLRLDTAYGPLELAMDKVATIDVAAGNSDPTAVVELTDHSRLRGTLRDPVLELTTADGAVERLAAAAVREIKVVRAADLSVAAIAVGLVTLSAMEIVLGIDNIIFLAIIAGRLPRERQPQARRIGLAAALGTRIVLLFSLTWLLGLTRPIFRLPFGDLDPDVVEVSWRDIFLFAGGVFLIGKSVMEMHHKLEEARGGREMPPAGAEGPSRKGVTFAGTIAQIAVIDIVFSLDSVITAVGMVDVLWVMVVAMVIAMLVMLLFAGPISEFVERHPTIKMLALSFLILIGVLLVAEALGQHISKGYIYFAMAFAVVMELVNMRLRPRPEPTAESPADT